MSLALVLLGDETPAEPAGIEPASSWLQSLLQWLVIRPERPATHGRSAETTRPNRPLPWMSQSENRLRPVVHRSGGSRFVPRRRMRHRCSRGICGTHNAVIVSLPIQQSPCRGVLLPEDEIRGFRKGAFVKCRRTGRKGVISRVTEPGSDARRYYVTWADGMDLSLMGAAEIEST